MAVVDTLITEYKANTRDYTKGVDQAVSSTNKFGGAVSMGLNTLTIFASAVMAAGAALTAFGVYAGNKAAEFDALLKSLEAVVGGAVDAKKALEELRDIAALPGLGLEEALRGYTSLRRAGLDDDMAMRTIRGAGNANALASGGRVELERILATIAKIGFQGKVQGDELNSLAEAGIAAPGFFQSKYGTVDSGELQKLGVGAKEAIETLTEGMEALPKASGSAKNSIENLGMAVDMAVVAIGAKVNELMIPVVDAVGGGIGAATDNGLFELFIDDLISSFEDTFGSFEITVESVERTLVDFAAASVDAATLMEIAGSVLGKFVDLLVNVIPGGKNIKLMKDVGSAFAGQLGNMERGSALRAEYEENKRERALAKKEKEQENEAKRAERDAQREADAEAKRQLAAQEAAEDEAKALAEQSASYLREQLAWSRRAALAAETLVELNKSFFGSSSYGENVLSPVNLSGSPSGGLVGAMQGMIQMELIKAMERR